MFTAAPKCPTQGPGLHRTRHKTYQDLNLLPQRPASLPLELSTLENVVALTRKKPQGGHNCYGIVKATKLSSVNMPKGTLEGL